MSAIKDQQQRQKVWPNTIRGRKKMMTKQTTKSTSLSKRNNSFLLLVVLFALATAATIQTTTSLPAAAQLSNSQQQTTIYHHQSHAISVSTIGPTAAGEEDNDDGDDGDNVDEKVDIQGAPGSKGEGPYLDMAIQMALVSVKGSLAFWRPTDFQQDDLTNTNNRAENKQLQYFGAKQKMVPLNGRPVPANIKCPQNQFSQSSSHQLQSVATSSSSLGGLHQPKSLSSGLSLLFQRAPQATSTAAAVDLPPELVAVEGTSIKLNLVIIGHRFNNAPATDGSANSNNNNQQQMNSKQYQLKLYWTKNGEQLIENSGARSRFNQRLINENDIIRQYFSQSSATFHNISSSASSSSRSSSSYSTKHQSSPESLSSSSSFGNGDRFMLSPHVNDIMMGRLRTHSALDATKLINAAIGSKRLAQSLNLVDDFLAEGHSIDWQKLEAYLRFNAASLRLYLPSTTSGQSSVDQQATEQQHQDNKDSCLPPAVVLGSLEQLTIVQIEMSQLTIADRGLYQLYACIGRGRHGHLHLQDCHQQTSFALQVVEDVPNLESKPEHLILEPGDRLSIKCEATGFTLPQITWFLDGQQLNEHQSSDSTLLGGGGGDSSMMMMLMMTGGQSRLRIGDYVSQDNHVHSFVNSSQLSVTDGGFYKCQANNGFHAVEHESRIDVRGPPTIGRHLNNISVLVGQSQLHIQCPYSGYPISSIEWYYRPGSGGQHNNNQHVQQHPGSNLKQSSLFTERDHVESSAYDDDSFTMMSRPMSSSGGGQFRARRVSPSSGGDSTRQEATQEETWLKKQSTGRVNEQTDAGSSSDFLDSNGDSSGSYNNGDIFAAAAADTDIDPDQDDWLSQANSLTPPTSSDQEYPDQLPDYPPSAAAAASLIPLSSYYSPASSAYDADLAGADSSTLLQAADYSDISLDLQQQQQSRRKRRKKRETETLDSGWVKFPQSRRHQIHLNGTLIIQDVSRSDQGFYKCRVLAPASSSGRDALMGDLSNNNKLHQHQLDSSASAANSEDIESRMLSASSNEFHLTVLVPPVVSPFTSADSLREGMRNFLTCSVIEGDSPVSLHWLKDNQPIEEYIQKNAAATSTLTSAPSGSSGSQQQQLDHSGSIQNPSNPMAWPQQQQLARIRVETSNEYTSTLYFSHVDFKDNGNYTCMATNKAASVNYTAKMLVNVPPKWMKAPKDIECVSGQNIVIDCQAQAHPNPRVWWEIGVYSSPDNSNNNNNNKEPQSSKQNSNQNRAADLVAPPTGNINNYNNNNQIAAMQHHHPPNHYRTIISNSRIHILENASLVIKDIQKADQGYYLCQAANNFGSLSSLIKLTVNVGASFSSKYLMKYVKINEKIELDCDPVGQSPVDVVWYMRHSSVASSSSSTSSAPSSASSANHTLSTGSYTTTSINHHLHHQQNLSSSSDLLLGGSSSSRAASGVGGQSLGRRLFMGTISTELHQWTHSGSKEATSTLSGVPISPTMTGYQSQGSLNSKRPYEPTAQQQMVDLDSSISFELVRRPDGQSEFVRLIIRQAKRMHSADFICQASNRYGSDEKLIKLLVQEPPDPVYEMSAVQVDSRSVAITWLPPYNGNSPISSYTVEWAPLQVSSSSASSGGSLLVSSTAAGASLAVGVGSSGSGPLAGKWSHLVTQQPAATITSLQPMTSYEIRVRAHNQFGVSPNSHSSPPMLITTIEEAPSSPPTDIRVMALSSSSLQLTWLSPLTSVGQTTTTTATTTASSSDAATALSTGDSAAAMRPSSTSRYSIKGYYLGYKVANSNESFIFKTVSLVDSHHGQTPQSSNGGDIEHSLLATPELGVPAYNLSSSSSSARLSPLNDARRLRVVIGDLKRSTRYAIIVQAFNSAGPGPQSDQIETKTLDNDPPPAPLLRVGLVTYTSIELQWSFQIDQHHQQQQQPLEQALITRFSSQNNLEQSLSSAAKLMSSDQNHSGGKDVSTANNQQINAVDGYHLYYRSANEGQWMEKKLAPDTHTIIATNHQRNDLSIVELASLSSTTSASLSNNDDQMKQISGDKQVQAPTATTTSGWHTGRNSSLFNQYKYSFRFILDQLTCGNSYQLYLVAYNSIGSGMPSQIIRTKTRGSAPIAPRKQDYIAPNSSYVQLNFDSWMDGGCSISNFEIRYKRLNSRAAAISSQLSSSTSLEQQNSIAQQQQQWLLFSSNISPEQRMIELRDLQPETWYSVLTIAESAAGKTEVQYSFMTLDKFGQIPIEALEANNLPALFRSNKSIQSILYNMSPLLMSACMCLILFVTCSLLLVRRCNGLAKDSASMDSQTTSGALSSHYHGPLSDSTLGNDHTTGGKLMSGTNTIYGGGIGVHEHYSMKASPCKTTTTILTGSSSLANGSSSSAAASAAILGGSSSLCNDNNPYRASADATTGAPDQPVDLSQFINNHQSNDMHAHCVHPQFHSSTLTHHPDEFCSSLCDSPMSPGKFARDGSMEPNHNSRFKTMPHQSRPISSFIPNNNNYQGGDPTNRFICNNNIQQQQQQLQSEYQQHIAEQQQQIYSKLRLIYNTNSNYNLCPDGQTTNKSVPPTNEQTCNGQMYNGDTINLAVLAQQNQKMLACTLTRAGQQPQNHYMSNGCAGQMPVDTDGANPSELTLLVDFQQQQQQHQQAQMVDQNNNNNNYGQYQVGQQIVNNVTGEVATNGFNTTYGAPSITSGSTSTTNSTHPTSSSSISNNNNTTSDQLINIVNGNNNNNASGHQSYSRTNQVSCKINNTGANATNQQQASQPTNEQNDYALPFPPKWV